MPSSANRPENGGISFRVPEEAQGWRLDKALGLLLASPSPEQEAARPGLFALADLGLRARRRLCDRSLVLVNGKPGIPGLKLRAGQEIIILPDPEGAAIPEDAPSLVYKDGGIAALYKPAGMHTAALAGSLSQASKPCSAICCLRKRKATHHACSTAWTRRPPALCSHPVPMAANAAGIGPSASATRTSCIWP